MSSIRRMTILMADDDEDDRLLAQDAITECGVDADLKFVGDGFELLEYLHQVEAGGAGRPDLILLDLNMPRVDGRESLRQIKASPALRRIPIVILTTSRSNEDVWKAYDDGANSYVTKPVTYEGLVDVMRNLRTYWAETVQLPADGIE